MKTLILTDHTHHSNQNSVYALARTLATDPRSSQTDIASRGLAKNNKFFQKGAITQVHGMRVDAGFDYDPTGSQFTENTTPLDLADYDLIWLRLPHPIAPAFLKAMDELDGTEKTTVVNRPSGVKETGDKAYLFNWEQFCAPMSLVKSVGEITEFAKDHPIVLKPLRGHGGKGIVKVSGKEVSTGNDKMTLTDWVADNTEELRDRGFLAVQFLEGVSAGDKRILVVNGKILAASLRLPAPDSWLCNVAQGGTSVGSEVTAEEETMVAAIAPEMIAKGVCFFGMDTLEGDDGKRILSELNTLSIGGFPQAQEQTGRPVVQQAVDELFNFVETSKALRSPKPAPPTVKQVETVQTINDLSEAKVAPGELKRYWLRLISDPLGEPVRIPVLYARGAHEGPKLALTAAVHGDELNGIRVIQRLFEDLPLKDMRGTVIGVPVVNVPAFFRQQRRYADGVDINHIMPGRADGNASQIYAARLMDRLVKHFDYLLDLHTASRGRVNSYYIRADMSGEATRQLALLQNPQLIVHNPPSDGTLRGAAAALDIPAITLEVGNPSVYQKKLIRSGLAGVHNVLSHLNITDDEIEPPATAPIICRKSYWLYTDTGGLLTVEVELLQSVKAGQVVATLRDVFGRVKKRFKAPEAGVVIGKSTNPVNSSGGRILHLGIV